MVSTLQTLSSILGPSSERYFGSRYTHVVPAMTSSGKWYLSDDAWMKEGIAEVRLSGLWSKMGSTAVVPHVSTIDVVSIALQASEQSLMRFAGDSSWSLASVSVKAPTAPVEDGLDRIPFTTSFLRNGDQVRTETQISGFTVVADMEPVAEPSGTRNAEARVYSDLFRSRVPMIHGIELSAGAVHTRTEVRRQKQAEVGGVLDAHRGDGLNAIDAFVVSLQLGQVLLYELDGLTRAESDTLWMRTTRIVAHGAKASASEVSASLEDSRIRNLRGDEWRLATIRGALPGLFDVTCAVAHRLPR